MYLSEIADLLERLYAVKTSRSALCRVIQEIGLTRKKIKVMPKQRDDVARLAHHEIMQVFDMHMLVFVDETGEGLSATLRLLPKGHPLL